MHPQICNVKECACLTGVVPYFLRAPSQGDLDFCYPNPRLVNANTLINTCRADDDFLTFCVSCGNVVHVALRLRCTQRSRGYISFGYCCSIKQTRFSQRHPDTCSLRTYRPGILSYSKERLVTKKSNSCPGLYVPIDLVSYIIAENDW